MPVVTIGRLLGSRGDEIGRALAERLNYRYLDHRLLLDYVREFGEVEANAPEIAETRPPLTPILRTASSPDSGSITRPPIKTRSKALTSWP